MRKLRKLFYFFLTSKDLLCYVFQISADWERASLRPSSQPSSVFKQSPQDETYITEGEFINTNLVQDEESQEFDDLIFALKTGKPLSSKNLPKSLQIFSNYNNSLFG